MKCERCGNIEAIFHLTEVAEEALTQRHLCRACAEAEATTFHHRTLCAALDRQAQRLASGQ